MLTCPLCLNSVQKLKTNSHIIPRWMLSHIKENGRVVVAHTGKGAAKKSQSDMKADIVCSDCEDRFTQCDSFSSKFFREEVYKEGVVRVGTHFNFFQVEMHKAEAKAPLIRFMASLVIRMHLYQALKGDSSLKEFFDKIRLSFVENSLQSLNLKIHLVKYTALPRLHGYPKASSEEDAVDTYIFGTRVTLYFGQIPVADKALVDRPEVWVLLIVGKMNKFVQDVISFVKRTKISNARRN